VTVKEEQYRRKAQDCDRMSDEAKEPEAKRMLKEAAEQWRQMAAQAERHGW
jgi:hypothetical protein